MLRKIILGITILIVAAVVIAVAWIIFMISAVGGFDKDYSLTELKEHYHKKETELRALKQYVRSVTPKDAFVAIEFDNNRNLSRLDFETARGIRFQDWDLAINTPRMDSILKPLGWTKEILHHIKDKLDDAGCIGIKSGEPGSIYFQRSGMGMYSFLVFDQPVPDSLKSSYNDSCTYILAADKLVLEYGGGAIGTQCFYNLK